MRHRRQKKQEEIAEQAQVHAEQAQEDVEQQRKELKPTIDRLHRNLENDGVYSAVWKMMGGAT